MTRLARLLAPRRLVVIGGGAWGAAIMGAAQRIGYEGEIVPVHREGKPVGGVSSVRRLEDVEGPIDAAFVAINRHASVDAVATLRKLGAGGAVCFASGFTEAAAEDAGGAELQAALVAAAGEMPILGPNCYGFVNALDKAAIWPDQHGMAPVERGVAILCQSSNVAINLTMQRRALPLGLMVACGNMAQTSQARIALDLLEDHRITAIGCHVEGFGDVREWEALAAKAHARVVPIVALKVGRSAEARAATVSHTASLAGSDAGAQALLERLGIARVTDIPAFVEALKLLHVSGPLRSARLSAISCSGGEASLVADMSVDRPVTFPPLSDGQRASLRATLGPMVALANPLDYHTYIWRDTEAMTRTFAAMNEGGADATVAIVDYPVTDATDWECATRAAIGARARSGKPFLVAATLPELMPGDVAARLMAAGVCPVAGLGEALSAIEAAAAIRAPVGDPVALAPEVAAGTVLDEAAAKEALRIAGVPVPEGRVTRAEAPCAEGLTGPLAVKGLGVAHKSEAGAVRLGVPPEALASAAAGVGTPRVLVEEMVTAGVAELLVGVTRDPAHGFVLTIGTGGIFTELLADTASVLIPSSRASLEAALRRLKGFPLLDGFRGRPKANLSAVLDAVEAVQRYVLAHADTVVELEINPLICTPDRAVAADALIREAVR